MAGREKMASPSASPTVRRSERACTPARTLDRNERAPTPSRTSRAGTPFPTRNSRAATPARSMERGSRASTPAPSSRGLKTTETQTVGVDKYPKRSSLSLPPPLFNAPITKKRFSTPYNMRSESPMRTLRNGKQQRMDKSSILLDGIPIEKKRTRSLISLDSDSSSVFNDTASAIDGYQGRKTPDLGVFFESRQNSASSQDSMTNTPHRGRVGRLSESSSLAASPLASPSLLKPSDNKSAKSMVKRNMKNAESSTQGSRKKKQTDDNEVKRKRKIGGNAGQSAKKARPAKKTAVEEEAVTVDQCTETMIRLPTKPVLGPLGRRIGPQEEDTKKTEGKKTATNRGKKLADGPAKVIKKEPAVKNARGVAKNNKETSDKKPSEAKHEDPNSSTLKRKPMGQKPVKRLGTGKKVLKVQLTMMANQRKAKQVLSHKLEQIKFTVANNDKSSETAASSLGDKSPVMTAESSTSTPTMKKFSRLSSSDMSTSTMQDSQMQTDVSPQNRNSVPTFDQSLVHDFVNDDCDGAKKIMTPSEKAKYAASFRKASIAKKARLAQKVNVSTMATQLKNVRAAVQVAMPRPSPSKPQDTLKTLTEVSQILEKFAKTPEPEPEDRSKDSESTPVTPAPCSPKIPMSLLAASDAEGNRGSCPDDELSLQRDSTQVSPLNDLATKLRKKLISSPTRSESAPSSVLRPGLNMPLHLPLPVVPIVNSLSDAAKLTSSFKHEDPPVPAEKWMVNKTSIMQKLIHKKGEDGVKSNPMSPNFGSSSSFTGLFDGESGNGDAPEESWDGAGKQNGDLEHNAEPEGLDSNENQLKKTDQEGSALKSDTSLSDTNQAEESTSALLVGGIVENHSSLTVETDEALVKQLDKDRPLPSADSGMQVDIDTPELSSDTSNLTPNSHSPTDKPVEPAETASKSFSVETSVQTTSKSMITYTSSLGASSSSMTFTSEIASTSTASISAPTLSSSSLSLLESVANRVIPLPYEEEDMVAKVSVLGALGLQSNKVLSEQQANKAPKVPKLRLVCRPITGKKHRRSANHDGLSSGYKEQKKTYTVCREGDPLVDWDRPSPSKNRDSESDTPCKSLLWYPRMPISNGKALETFSEVTLPEPGVGVGDGMTGEAEGEKTGENLVIPEKSSSFAIHPGRLCEDVCCYCHNKFGLYDTPLHVAQLKGDEKQRAVLAREPLLSLESCLCDACFRHLDRPGPPKGSKPAANKAKPQPDQSCAYLGCNKPVVHPMMRKWKRRARSQLRPEAHDPKSSAWLCENHYSRLSRIGSCTLCRRRLTSQQLYSLEAMAAPRLTKLLRRDNMPVTLDANTNLCKKCRYYASLRLRSEDHTELNASNRLFLREHRARVLKSLDIEPSTLPDVFAEPEKQKKQPKKKATAEAATGTPPAPSTVTSNSPATGKQRNSNSQQQQGSPQPQASVKVTPTSRKMQTQLKVGSGGLKITSQNKMVTTIQGPKGQTQVRLNPASGIKLPSQTKITLQNRPASSTVTRPTDRADLRRVAAQNSSTLLSRLGLVSPPSANALLRSPPHSTPQITIEPVPPVNTRRSVSLSPPGQSAVSDVAMTSTFEFQPAERGSAWQKVNATFQFDRKTRQMWHTLHAPYGSYTSFLRHLVLLENYWRNGELTLSSTASERTRQYLHSVQNRIRSYEGIPPESDTTMGSVPQISEVRSLASTSGTSNWSVNIS